MEFTQNRPGKRRKTGQGQAHRQIVGKARVESARKGNIPPRAPATCGPAQRALGRDIDRIGGDRGQLAPEATRRGEGERDLRIEWHRQGPPAFRRDDLNLMAVFGELVRDGAQRADDAVNLREPGVRYDGYPHWRPLSDYREASPFDDLEATVMVLDERGAALDPVAVIHVMDVVDHAVVGGVGMATDYALGAALAGLADHRALEMRDEFDRFLDLEFEIG